MLDKRKKKEKINKEGSLVGAGGATGMADIESEEGIDKRMEELRVGEISGKVWSETADTSAFPSYINKKGGVTHKGPRAAVAEDITSERIRLKGKKKL